jgi:hypothetical protein
VINSLKIKPNRKDCNSRYDAWLRTTAAPPMAMDGPDHIAEGNGGGGAWIGKVAGSGGASWGPTWAMAPPAFVHFL